jgi:hypothetical protein
MVPKIRSRVSPTALSTFWPGAFEYALYRLVLRPSILDRGGLAL